MIRRRFILIVTVFALAVMGPPTRAETGDPAKGKVIYDKLCIACHGAQGKGDGPAGQMMRPPATDLTSAKIKGKADTDLFHIIKEGRPPTAMAAFETQLSDQQIHDVLAYVRILAK